jgi:transposase
LVGDNADTEGMPAPLPIDVRERMLAAYDAKLGTQHEVARMFGVGRQCLSELLRHRRTRGTITPSHGGGYPPAYGGKRLEKLRRLVQQQPDITLAELRDRTGVACSLVTVHNTLLRLDLRYKKSRSTPASRTDPTW